MSKATRSIAGTLHRYTRRLSAFEHKRHDVPDPQHTLIWVGGLGDNLLTVDYPTTLSQRLPPDWSLIEATTSASLNGWGTTSLATDATELSRLVDFVRKLRPDSGRIVLMGHSTGCQDAMEYVTGPDAEKRNALNGVILQASASDREGLDATKSKKDRDDIVETAQTMVSEERSEDVLCFEVARPVFGSVPTSAYRALSLLSPSHDGDDDYFSSDLSDIRLQRTFGRFPSTTPLLMLFSGNDEHVPQTIDKQALLQRWGEVVRKGGGVVDEENGGIVLGASHNLNGDDAEVVNDLCNRINHYLTDFVMAEHNNPRSRY